MNQMYAQEFRNFCHSGSFWRCMSPIVTERISMSTSSENSMKKTTELVKYESIMLIDAKAVVKYMAMSAVSKHKKPNCKHD